MIKLAGSSLEGVRVIETRYFADERGGFFEAWNQRALAQAGVEARFVQDNVSISAKGVLRGLHFQTQHPQGKLVRCLTGAVFDVAVDLRINSASFGRWMGLELSEEGRLSLWIPPGFAHGFLALSDGAMVSYKCTDFYAPQHQQTLAWNDPALGIDWPLAPGEVPLLSAKDRQGLSLASLSGGLEAG